MVITNDIKNKLVTWAIAIRTKFLLSSIVAVANGVMVALWKDGIFDPFYTIMTFLGVICLHISVDLLNDYWDSKKGIDTNTIRTKFSGGTGVIPNKQLNARSVLLAGIIFLILGFLIGIYFVTVRGIAILIILLFATAAVFFYSTQLVSFGMGELFVGIKGMMIVLGSYFVQTGFIDSSAICMGVIIGIISSSVIITTSFPDFVADKKSGRRTIVIILGKRKTSKIIPILIGMTYFLIILTVIYSLLPKTVLVSLLSLPIALKAITLLLKEQDNLAKLVLIMHNVILYARITGSLLFLGIIFDIVTNHISL
jgi:1,4-dihydroxy-2-naphthoate octaprenyltransferase